MNGPEHYRRAEKFLVAVTEHEADPVTNEVIVGNTIAAAQAHATLALAAATAMYAAGTNPGSTARGAWRDVVA